MGGGKQDKESTGKRARKSPKKYQFREFTDKYRKYLPSGNVYLDVFYVVRLFAFFHVMFFARILATQLLRRNMASSFGSFVRKLKAKGRANRRDAMLFVACFGLSMLSLCFN